MINAKALCYDDENTKKMLKIEEEEHPVAVQIFGSDPEYMGKAAQIMNKYPNEILDINMGCPAPKVVKNGDGSALMKNPELTRKVLTAVVQNSEKPVTLKIRKGWDDNSVNAVEIAKLIEKAGANAIAIHGRTRAQMYSGKADWKIIKEVKEAVKIPVIGNGDIKNALDAKRMIEETGVDAVMVARATLGNPWIFKEINAYLETGVLIERPTLDEIYEVILRHVKYLRELKGDHLAMLEMRGQIAYYLKGLPNSTAFKNELFKTKTIEDTLKLVEQYFENNK